MNTSLSTAYNYYMTSYASKKLTRFDTHKRSELRGVYNSIVLLAKESPWYLLPGKDLQEYAITLKESSRELHNSVAQLGGSENDGLFSQKSAFSSNDEFVSASYIGSEKLQKDVPEFDVEVHSLASPQENLGLFLENVKVSLPSDTYSFDVSINDVSYEFQFTVAGTESNLDIQKRLAKLINGADIGLKASVVELEEKYSLRLVSDSSGLPQRKDCIFSISDRRTSRTAGAVSYFGLDDTSKEASNANYSIDGKEYTANSNYVTVRNQFELQLKGITPDDEPVHIGLKTDIESLTDNVAHLMERYNGFISAASSSGDDRLKNRQLILEFKEIASTYRESFDSMGITLTEDGTLDFDKKLLHQTAASSEDIPQTFEYIQKFAAQLLRKSSQISLNPMAYVKKTVVAYKNPGRNFISPYITCAYSGMMFNGYC